MNALDSSVLVAALVDSEPRHKVCGALLDRSDACVYSHAITETFNTLTGGRSGYRISAAQVAELIDASILPCVQVVVLSARDLMTAIREADSRGVRGAAIFDYLHFASARKARANRLYTLDAGDFKAFHRKGEPEIVEP